VAGSWGRRERMVPASWRVTSPKIRLDIAISSRQGVACPRGASLAAWGNLSPGLYPQANLASVPAHENAPAGPAGASSLGRGGSAGGNGGGGAGGSGARGPGPSAP